MLGYLGDYGYSEASLQAAQRTLDAIDVVGITERMDESMVLVSERFGLPLKLLRHRYVSLLVNPSKPPLNKSTLAAVAAHPGVQRETVLYQYALRRFERDVAGVSQLEEKAARLKSAMQVAAFEFRP